MVASFIEWLALLAAYLWWMNVYVCVFISISFSINTTWPCIQTQCSLFSAPVVNDTSTQSGSSKLKGLCLILITFIN